MKSALLLLLIAFGFTSQAQSLKDLLYSGKLKSDSNTVVRKGDDLSTKIDTATKKPVEAKTTTATEISEPDTKPTVTASGEPINNVTEVAVVAAIDPKEAAATTAKSNTKIWKDYTDSLIASFKTELLPSKKIKKDTYHFVVEYEIGITGQVSVLNVFATPENSFFQDEVKKRMDLTVPQMAPVSNSAGKPQKVKRKYSFSLTKE